MPVHDVIIASTISRMLPAVIFQLRPEPYQPLSIPPFGGATLLQGAQNSVPSPLSPTAKSSIPELKYEALEISEVRRPFERKVLMYYRYFGPLSKQFYITTAVAGPFESKVAYYTLQLLLCPFESKVLYTLQLQRGARGSAR